MERGVRERPIARDGWPVEATRRRLLEAARLGLSRFGTRKLSMTDVADLAGVTRPTLYRYFPSKEALIAALGEDEQQRYDAGLTAAVRDRPPAERLDAALRFLVDFLQDDRLQALVNIEPAFVLERFAELLPAYRARFAALIAESSTAPVRKRSSTARHDQAADVVVRLAMSYFLFPEPNTKHVADGLRAVARSANHETTPP
jgi:AcrR family transcriptional regulator